MFLLLLSATSIDTQNCPFTGKFDVTNLVQNKRDSGLSKYSQKEDSRYFDSNFYFRKQRRSIYFEQLEYGRRRVKRVDEDFDCDSNGFTKLIIGCVSFDTMEFATDCSAPNIITCKYYDVLSLFVLFLFYNLQYSKFTNPNGVM